MSRIAPVRPSVEDCLIYFEQQGILEQFVAFVDPEHRAYDERIVQQVDQVKGLLHDLRMRSPGGRCEVLADLARSGSCMPVDCELASAWSAICTKRGKRFERLIAQSGGAWQHSGDAAKQSLLALAEIPGALRPSGNLNEKLSFFTGKFGTQNDQQFADRVRKLKPEWFRTTKFAMRRQEIVELINTPGSRRPPSKKHSLGSFLTNMLLADRPSYDQEVRDLIQEKKPGWLREGKLAEKQMRKAMILEMALDRSVHSLPLNLSRRKAAYASPSNPVYDEDFAKQIRKLRPEWFHRRSSREGPGEGFA